MLEGKPRAGCFPGNIGRLHKGYVVPKNSLSRLSGERFTHLFPFILACCIAVFSGEASAQSDSWTKIEGPYAGSAYAIAADLQGRIYIETQYGFVFRSTDHCKSWVQADSGLGNQTASYLTIDSSGDLYTGDAFSGLYKSTNNGTSWSKTSLDGSAASAAFLKDGRLYVGGIREVSVSTDGGNTWTSHQVTNENVNILSLAEDSLGNLYAGLQSVHPRFTPPYGGGVYMSSDSGKTWVLLGLRLSSIVSILVNGSGRVFASAQYGIFTASQADTGWTETNFGIPRSNVWSLALTPDKKVVAATDNGVYLYDSNSVYWNEVGHGLSSTSIRSICYLADGTMLAGSSRNGVFRLADNGQDWEQVGFTETPVNSLGVGRDGDLYAGTGDAIYRLAKGSDTWVAASGWYNGGQVTEMFVVDSLQRLYAASSGGLFYTTDRGARWTLSLDLNVTCTEISRSGVLYVGTTTGVMSSWDLGRSWTKPNDIALPTSPVNDIAVDSAGNLFAGMLNNGVFRTTDGGGFWNQTGLTSILMFRTVKALVIDKSGRILAGTDSFGAFFTSDEGSNWSKIGSTNSAGITQFFIDSSGYYLAATSDDGVLYSRDGLDDWKPINDGLTDTCVNALVSDDNSIYAATESGVFKRSRTISTVVTKPPLPRSFVLEQNYPNPFNPTTNIEYRIANFGFVSLKVYDVLGREVATLVNGRESAGKYTVMFDASRLPSGVYFYRLQTGSYSVTKKMVLIR